MAQTIYKKVTLTLPSKDGDVTIQCLRIKSDNRLTLGEDIVVRGELKNRNGTLEFGTGCTCIKAINQPAVDEETLQAVRALPEGEAYANGFCAMTGKVEEIVAVPNDKPQKVTLFVGALTMFVAAVFYMIMSDLIFKNTSTMLIIATLLSFGSAILFFLSANFGEKKVIMYLLKAIGMLLGVGFIIYLHLVMTLDPYYLGKLEEFKAQGISGTTSLALTQVTVIATLALSYVAVVVQVVNTVIVALTKEE